MTGLRERIADVFNLRRGELAPALVAGLFFFCVLAALMLLRPARDALGMESGIDSVRWLFIGTAVVTLAVNPVFGWLVSRFRRMHFITATYAFFALSLAGFWALLVFAPEAVGTRSGQVFYVWFSVFNLFATMVFWALMVDRFSSDQGKRLFALIAVGGTLGAIFGPWLASRLAEPLGTPALLLVAAGFLLLAVVSAWWLVSLHGDAEATEHGEAHGNPVPPPARPDLRIGGSAWEGIRAVFASPYLLGIAGYVLAMTVVATFIYFTRLQMVAEAESTLDARASLFGNIDMWTQVAVLVMQLALTGQIIRRFGLPFALALLPIANALGFIGLAVFGSFAALILLEAVNKSVQRGLTRPARESLFTVISREDKYKSKAFIDTFVYRAGDVVGAQVEGLLGRLGLALGGLVGVVLPLALAWAMLGIWLGRTQQRRAADID